MSSRTNSHGTVESVKSLKLKLSLIATSDLIINSWYLTQTIQSIYETVHWVGWKYDYDFVTIYSSLLSSLSSSSSSPNTSFNAKFDTNPANNSIIAGESEEEQEQFNSTEKPAIIQLTIHDKHKLMWLTLDSIFAILTIIILIAALCLILSSIIGQSLSSLKIHLIRFWIFCNYFVALILLSTYLIRLSFTHSYLLAPIYLIAIFTYLCIRYKWVRISRKYIQLLSQQDHLGPHHHSESYYAFTLQVPLPSPSPQQQQNLHLTTTATSSSSSFL